MSPQDHSIVAAILQAYQAEAEAELGNILAFWQQHALDEQHGGFVGRMDNSGRIDPEAPKGAVLNARILWTFSAAFKHTGRKEYLQLAKRAYSYLMLHFRDNTYGGIYWEVDAKGTPRNTRKQIYALAFAIYGLSEYYSISREAAALEASQELFRWIEQYSFDPVHGGYFEAFSREGVLLEDLRLSPKDRNEPKTMNTHLHILEAYAKLYQSWPDEQLGRQLENLIGIFLDRIVDARSLHLQLFFTRTWQSAARLVSYGHDIEAAWLLQEAAHVLGQEELITRTRKLAVAMARATTEGLQPDGSLYHELDLDARHWDKHREWWVSAEAMVGFLNAYQLTGDEQFLAFSLNSWRFVQQHLLDKEKGEWRWGVYDDYTPMLHEDKVGFWKCPYHNSRACIEVAQRCNQLLQKLNFFV